MLIFINFMDYESKRIRELYIETIGNCKESELDKHYLTCSAGSFTRREIIKEVKENTLFSKKLIDNLFKLVIDFLERGKAKQID